MFNSKPIACIMKHTENSIYLYLTIFIFIFHNIHLLLQISNVKEMCVCVYVCEEYIFLCLNCIRKIKLR